MLLLKVFSEFLKENKEAHLLIVGDGELREEINHFIIRRGIEDNVHLLGVRSDIPQLLKSADLYILPSNYETLPIGLIEAVASGIPIIATNVRGNLEVVENESLCWLFEPGDAKRLLDLIKLVHKKKQTGELSRRILSNQFREKFDIKNNILKHERLYISLAHYDR